jgi:two-component system, response regulator YesN
MIRVLVVDDDKLVRRGIVSSMPWQDFGMEVAGEANNGENALKFMEAHEIDLLMTDLSMPVMSGIELMRIVRSRYPHVQIVVLTLHQDFEYIQEALRIGAIDYIAKYQLEREQFEEVLGRIVSLLGRRGSGLPAAGPLPQDWVRTDRLYVCYELEAGSDDAREAYGLPEQATEAESGAWYWQASHNFSFQPSMNAAFIRFNGLQDMDRSGVMQLIRAYRKNELFYDHDPAKVCLDVDVQELHLRIRSAQRGERRIG